MTLPILTLDPMPIQTDEDLQATHVIGCNLQGLSILSHALVTYIFQMENGNKSPDIWKQEIAEAKKLRRKIGDQFPIKNLPERGL
jgi:hypothetical protein